MVRKRRVGKPLAHAFSGQARFQPCILHKLYLNYKIQVRGSYTVFKKTVRSTEQGVMAHTQEAEAGLQGQPWCIAGLSLAWAI